MGLIKIRRTSCPPTLHMASPTSKRYALPSVRSALHKMQHGKCCYCEAIIPPRGDGQAVEHFRPRKLYPQLKNVWSNLLLACSQCNGNKHDQFVESKDGRAGLLDPSDPTIDPEDHIAFITSGPLALIGSCTSKNGSVLGETTIDTVKLDSPYYQSSRNVIHDFLVVIHRELAISRANGDDRKHVEYRSKMECLTSPRSPFAAFARSYVQNQNLESKYGVEIASNEVTSTAS